MFMSDNLNMDTPIWVWVYDYGPSTHPEVWTPPRPSDPKAYPQAHTYAFRNEADALEHPEKMHWDKNHPYILQKVYLN